MDPAFIQHTDNYTSSSAKEILDDLKAWDNHEPGLSLQKIGEERVMK